MKPSIGRIVIFGWAKTPDSFCKAPAIITKVWSDDCVNLKVFMDANDGAVVDRTSVSKANGDPNEIANWNWPERV